ncbi:hypothetical protein MGN70_002903 [Eutypa lata]|nr:hypothetical protein MGN70_002903 [Eutypa lata]
MSLSQSAPSATLPRGFRYDQELDPRTPEPCAPNEETSLPSPPPRPRLRLKRRNVSQQLNAPTQQFLASVAAADVPLPSVERPEPAMIDQEMMMDGIPEVQVQVEDYDGMDIYQHIHPRTFSPPKTPAIDIPAALPSLKYPDWSVDSEWSSSDMDSSSDCESSRPSTAFSTQTSASLFSRYSLLSDDECLSPEPETEESTKPVVRREGEVASRKPRKAPWTKAMTAHLWSTYMLYLQDPKVTPIRLGKSCIPPHGVCLRVAREAKRSWKGSNLQAVPARSGNATPIADPSRPFVQWPHTCAATRSYLRELCRLKATAKAGRRHLMSRSPTPFNRAAHRRWNRRNTPGRSPSIFSSNDMNMSLTMSTSETMQPYGPLAQLASSQMEPFPDLIPSAEYGLEVSSITEPFIDDRARLGSPFIAKSYGPSSSTSLGANLNLPPQSNTVGSRKLLKSPVRLTRSRSGTQKRRSTKATEDPPRKRPSLSAAFGEVIAATPKDGSIKSSQQQANPSSSLGIQDDPFQPEPRADNSKLASFMQPIRLGSPFSGSNSSHSVPTRSSAPININFRRPFSTIQQPAQRRSETPPARSSLASRLAYLDQRLRDFRNRRRSQSPM